ncbi:hypothetical protein I4U23_020039 [Adineta vaga]|nr:hypothetical protein I4U23_020039 [Adineta vaga]
MKRLLIYRFSTNENIKKLRTLPYDDRKRANCFEDLPNEIHFEIFDYLEACHLYEAFSNLNMRFQNLLASFARLKMNLSIGSKELRQNRCTHILMPNKHRIVSLQLCNFLDLEDPLSHCIIDASFIRLESLRLIGISADKLVPLLIGLIALPHLFSLSIEPDDLPDDISNVYQAIFNLSSLKYNQLSFFSLELFIPLPIATKNQFTGIEVLVIDHRCTIDELINMLSYTSRLSRLSCSEVNESNKSIIKEALIQISSLKCIRIVLCAADFDELESLITKIAPQLEELHVTCCRDITYLDSDRWKRIVSKDLLKLRTFDFKYEENIDEDLEVTPYHTSINRFNSSFWLKRKSQFRIYINTDLWNGDTIIYSFISPSVLQTNFDKVKKQYADIVIENQYETMAESALSSEIYQLTITDNFRNDDDNVFIDYIGPMLGILKVSCLILERRMMFIGFLINLIQYLPHLESLVISSLSVVTPRYLSATEVQILRLVSSTNKITKVILQHMNDLSEVQFLIDLCPIMHYLEVTCDDDQSLENFIRFILMKNTKYIPNLSTICIKNYKTNEITINKLQHLIDVEQLRLNYIIKKIDKRIYLEWN